jgi:hypothetical protein
MCRREQKVVCWGDMTHLRMGYVDIRCDLIVICSASFLVGISGTVQRE